MTNQRKRPLQVIWMKCGKSVLITPTSAWLQVTSLSAKSSNMASRVTPAEVITMQQLYRELGNYAAVGRKLGRSGSTVAKYVKMQGVPQALRIAVENLANKM